MIHLLHVTVLQKNRFRLSAGAKLSPLSDLSGCTLVNRENEVRVASSDRYMCLERGGACTNIHLSRLRADAAGGG
jgi:soluble P-type ATPase